MGTPPSLLGHRMDCRNSLTEHPYRGVVKHSGFSTLTIVVLVVVLVAVAVVVVLVVVVFAVEAIDVTRYHPRPQMLWLSLQICIKYYCSLIKHLVSLPDLLASLLPWFL